MKIKRYNQFINESNNIDIIEQRFTQLSIIALYILANIYGINILMGNLSSSLV